MPEGFNSCKGPELLNKLGTHEKFSVGAIYLRGITKGSYRCPVVCMWCSTLCQLSETFIPTAKRLVLCQHAHGWTGMLKVSKEADLTKCLPALPKPASSRRRRARVLKREQPEEKWKGDEEEEGRTRRKSRCSHIFSCNSSHHWLDWYSSERGKKKSRKPTENYKRK